jgi:hypothetical protein
MGSSTSSSSSVTITILRIIFDIVVYAWSRLDDIIEKLRKKWRNRNKTRRQLIEENNLHQLEENERIAERNKRYYNK